MVFLPPPPQRRRGRIRRRQQGPPHAPLTPPGVPYLAASGSTGGTATTRTATVTRATAAGDTLLVQVSLGAAGFSVGQCTDSQGNTYTLDLFYATTSPLMAWYRAEGKTGGPGGNVPTVPLNLGDTISVITSPTSGTVVTTMLDVPGCSFDVVGTPATPSGTTTLSASVTPAGAGETIIFAGAEQATAASIFVNSPFVFAESSQPGGGVWHSWAYQQNAPAGTATGTSNWTGSVNARGICYALIPGGTPPSLPYVQASPPAHVTSLAGPVTLSFARPTQAGNTVVVCASSNGSTGNPIASGCTLGGSADNFAPAVVLDSATRNDAEIWYDPGAAAGQTAVAVTFTGGSGTGDLFLTAYELPGILALDQIVTGEGGASTTFTIGPTPATTQAAEFFIACQINTGNRTPDPTGAGNWLGNQQVLAATYQQISSVQQVAATGTATFTGTLSASCNWTGVVATFYTVPPTASIGQADRAAAADAISVAVSTPKMSALVDTFPGAALSSQWTAFGTTAVQGGSVALTDTTTTGWAGLKSASTYDLSNSQLAARLLSAGTQQANTQAVLCATDATANTAQIFVQNGSLACQHQVAGTFSGWLASVTYSAATHKWLRIREASGTLYYEWSTDGSTWTALYSEATPFTVTSLYAQVMQYNLATDPAATSQWTDVNNPATPYQSATGLTSGAGTSRTGTVATPTAAGDTLLALVTTQSTSCTISTLVDSKGNVYTLDRSAQVAVPMCYWFRSPGATGGPGGGPTAALAIGDTLTATSSANTGNVQILQVAVPGAGTLDLQTGPNNGTTGSPASGTFTPRADNEICLALVANANAGGQPAVTSAGWTGLTTYHTGVNPYSTVAYEQLGAGTNGVGQNFTATITAAQWYVPVWTFQQAVPTTPISVADVAAATEQQTVQAAVTAADAAGAADALTVSATVSLADAAGAAEASAASATVPLPDAAAAAEASAVAAAVPLAETGAAADTIANPARTLTPPDVAGAAEQLAAQAAVPLAEAAGATESLVVTVSVPLTDVAAASYAQVTGPYSFTQAVTVPLADQGGAAEAMTSGMPVSVADTAGAADAVVISGTTPLAERAAAADAVTASAAVPVADQAGAADQQAVQAAVPISEQAGATDALAIPAKTLPVPDAGGAADALTAAVTSPAADVAAATDALTVQQGIFITLTDAAGAADAPTVAAAVPVADQAAAAEAQGIGMPVALADTGAAADATVTAAQVPVSDIAAAADQASTAAAVPLAEQAGGADAVGTVVGAAPALNDTAAAAEAISSPASVPVADAAGAADSLSVIVGALATQADVAAATEAATVAGLVPIPDAAAAADSLATTAAAPLTEQAGAADALTVVVGAAPGLPDAAGATDALSVSVQVPLADAAGAADGLTAAVAAQPVLADAAGVTEALRAAVAAPSHDVAAASDSFVVTPAVDRVVSDSAGATDALVVTIPTIAPQPLWRCGAAAQQWSCALAALRWAVAAAAARWETEPSQPRWAVRMLAARWEAIMGDFKPIASISQANINVVWTSDLGGADVDPTAAPFPVKFAFPVSSGDENAPAQPATWFDGVWMDPQGRQKGWIAQCPVGPVALGGLLQLQPHTRYDVWSEVDTGTETVREFVGVQAVY